MNVDDVHVHLNKLKSISKCPITVKSSDQYHRYFWLPPCEIPGCLKGQLSPISKPGTDYSEGCNQVERFWRKKTRDDRLRSLESRSRFSERSDIISTINSQSTMIILPDHKVESMWKEFAKRDNVSQVLVDPNTTKHLVSSYQDSFSATHDRDPSYNTRYHIKSNPISKFGEAMIIHKSSIR
jgi:hypothetical protein